MTSLVVDDIELAQWVVEQGADVNARSDTGKSAILRAIANVSARSDIDESALSIAIARGSIEVARFLLARRADIAHGDLLHCAAQRKNQAEGADLVEYLVRKGADVNAYRLDNPTAYRIWGLLRLPTPLHVACEENNIPVARALLQHGADPHRKILEAGQPTDPTPLDKAIQRNDQALVAVLEATEVLKA